MLEKIGITGSSGSLGKIILKIKKNIKYVNLTEIYETV